MTQHCRSVESNLHEREFAHAPHSQTPLALLLRLVRVDFGNRLLRRRVSAEVFVDERDGLGAFEVADDDSVALSW